MNFKEFCRAMRHETVEHLREIEKLGFDAPFNFPQEFHEELNPETKTLQVFAGSLADKKERGMRF